MTFSTSDASDLDHYEIYADVIPFTDVGNREPAMIIDRDGNSQFQGGQGEPRPGGGRQAIDTLTIELTSISDGRDIDPGVMIWVAVVPVDSSENAWLTDLNVATATPIDDSLTDPGLHLPEITGIQATWNENRDEITVTWDESRDPQVVGYIVHLSPEVFEDVRAAQFESNMTVGTQLNNLAPVIRDSETINETWYASVVAFDGEVTRFGVTPVAVEDWIPGTDNSNVEIDEEGSGDWWNELSPMEMALMAVLTLMIILLSMIIVGRLRKPAFDPLKHATPNWELQVEDWGGDNYETTIEPEVNFEDTLMPAATTIRDTTTPTTSRPPPIDDLESLAGDLLGDVDEKKSDDPFNLDDIL